MRITVVALVLGAGLLTGCSSPSAPDGPPAPSSAPYLNATLPTDQRVADLLVRMTTAEKVGQMTQAERSDAAADPDLVRTGLLGSLLSGGGSAPDSNDPQHWADMVDGFQREALKTRLRIPLLYGVDSVHGAGNLVGATVFPHEIGLGAAGDPALAEQVGRITAEETRSSGPQWVFGPCVCSAQDDRWGRTYESFGEDPALVSRLETVIDGLQTPGPYGVLATAKHYAGDGLTGYDTPPRSNPGYPVDQGVTTATTDRFDRLALAQYRTAVREHHVGSVMTSFSSVALDGGRPVKLHADTDLVTGTLKGTMGFAGIVVSDWQGIHQIPDPEAGSDVGLTAYRVRTGVNAGIDMFMEPNNAPQFERLLLAEIDAGRVPMSRIDDAVRRILTAKFALGLFEHPLTDRSRIGAIGSAEHRAVARQAVAQSQVLLKNDGGALPLRPTGRIYVAGGNADDLGHQAGGWTVTWQGGSGARFPGRTVLQGIRSAAPGAQITYSATAAEPVAGYDVGIVVVGETPYAEGFGDVGGRPWSGDRDDPGPRPTQTMQLSADDAHAIDTVCRAVRTCVVSVISGRPVQIDPAQLAEADALVASWLPGSEGDGVADVLFGRRPFTGKLPVSWPRTVTQEPINAGDPGYDPLYPLAFGLTTPASPSASS